MAIKQVTVKNAEGELFDLDDQIFNKTDRWF